MAAETWVLIDTCIWASFFKRSQSREKTAVRWLIRRDRAAVIGPVMAEVLLGIRNRAHADWTASALRAIHQIELTWDDWRYTGHLGRQLAGAGHHLPLTDLALASVALRNNIEVFTTDPHFDHIRDLHRFVPSGIGKAAD